MLVSDDIVVISGEHSTCTHEPLVEDDRMYLKEHFAVEAVRDIVQAPKLLSVLHQIEPVYATSPLEGHNATINTFVSKTNAYLYEGYLMR